MTETNTPGENTGLPADGILIPLPDRDFDPTECAIPWKICTSRGWKAVFSTERGNVAQADPHLLRGTILGPLGAGAKALAAYREMTRDAAYRHPVPYAEIDPDKYAAILLPGGHASGVRPYLESPVLRSKVLQFWQLGKLIGAICHGVLVPARTINPETGHSILYGYKVTAPPHSLDRLGYLTNSRLLRRSYIKYSCYTADEVRACLKRPEDISQGPSVFKPYVVCDGNLITARYWHDAGLFAERFADELTNLNKGSGWWDELDFSNIS
jgi:putative intracellular protease/amidase